MQYRLNTIPLSPTPFYTREVAIDGSRYNFSFSWNRRLNCHFLTVTDAFGQVNIQNKKLNVGEKLIPLNLPQNSNWFLYYYSAGSSTILDKPQDFLLGAFVLE